MIRLNLEIHEPTRADSPKLRALAALFLSLADGTTAEQTRAALDNKTPERPERQVVLGGRQVGKTAMMEALSAADNPAAGMPTPAEAFRQESPETATLPDPAVVFAGNAATLPDPAAVFAGNAAAVPPPPSGPQLSSAATPQTVAPGSPALSPVSHPVPGNVPPPEAAPAPAATISNALAVELDSEGIPWDASIHASTKVKIANGTWKVKRGTGEAYLKERKALLKAAVSAGGNAGAPATPPANASVPPLAGAGVLGNAPAAIPTPQASQQTTPAAAGSNGAVTMARVLPRVTSAISAGLLTPDSAAAIVRELSDGKIDNVAMLAVAPALLAPFAARLDLLGIPQ